MDEILWAEIDLSAIVHNFNEVKRVISPNTEIMAVIKADAYGHGSFHVAKEVIEAGAKYLAVARIDEAIFLREMGIDRDILVFGYVPENRLKDALKYNFTISLFDMAQAKSYANIARSLGKRLNVHIKVDTGMGRLGFVLSDERLKAKTIDEIFEVFQIDGLDIKGIYTHFACADEKDLTFSYDQLKLFLELKDVIQKKIRKKILFHAANSAGVIQLPMAHLDIVRPGIMLYGLYPSSYVKSLKKVDLKPAMTLKARIAQVKDVGAGFKVSYGSTYKTSKKTRLATIPIGYADGYPRILSNKGEVLIKGKRAKICGRVCMDQMVVDCTDIDVKIGDEVLIFGKDKYGELSVDEVATWANTINYEIVSALTKRVKRIYKEVRK